MYPPGTYSTGEYLDGRSGSAVMAATAFDDGGAKSAAIGLADPAGGGPGALISHHHVDDIASMD